jgi:hypothetical protein
MRCHRKSKADGAHDAGGGATIIQFPRRTLLPGRRWRPITDPLRQFEDEEDHRRMRQNLVAGVVVVLLVMLGFWLIDHLHTSAIAADGGVRPETSRGPPPPSPPLPPIQPF